MGNFCYIFANQGMNKCALQISAEGSVSKLKELHISQPKDIMIFTLIAGFLP